MEAEKQGLPVLTPAGLADDALFERLKELAPDLFVVAAFKILPLRLFTLPKYGSINIHGSLLPRYRGAAPIHWALINGDTETGLSSFFLKETVDTGAIILQERTTIEPDATYDTLYAKLAQMAGPFCVRSIGLIADGKAKPMPQDESLATRAPKIGPFDALVDFGFPAEHVRNFIRGLATKPGAYTYFREKKVKLHAARVVPTEATRQLVPGTVIPDRKRLLVQCNSSVIELLKLVPEGKKEMDGVSFINGFKPLSAERFGQMPSGAKEIT
jgi:methionyl-tRNA formyltransferase